jgi:hypothetical protein
MKPNVITGVLIVYGILITYLLIKSLTSNTKEFHTPGATDNAIDPLAWTNLHTLLIELYSSGTLTIPGNLKIVGDLDIGGNVVSDLRANNLKVNNIFRLAGETADGDGNKWIRVHNDFHVGWGKKINTGSLEVYDISFPGNVTPLDGNYWIRFHNDVHLGWEKSLNVNGDVQIDGWAQISGVYHPVPIRL